jgi:hypothetical protein
MALKEHNLSRNQFMIMLSGVCFLGSVLIAGSSFSHTNPSTERFRISLHQQSPTCQFGSIVSAKWDETDVTSQVEELYMQGVRDFSAASFGEDQGKGLEIENEVCGKVEKHTAVGSEKIQLP